MSNHPESSRRKFLTHGGAATVALASLGSALGGPSVVDAVSIDDTAHAALKQLSLADFQPLLGQHFLVGSTGSAVMLSLEGIHSHARENDGRPAHARSEPFSLMFQAVGGSPLPSAIQEVRHLELGTFKVFISSVNAQPVSGKISYEVVFG